MGYGSRSDNVDALWDTGSWEGMEMSTATGGRTKDSTRGDAVLCFHAGEMSGDANADQGHGESGCGSRVGVRAP